MAQEQVPDQITYNPVYQVTYEGADPSRGYVYTRSTPERDGICGSTVEGRILLINAVIDGYRRNLDENAERQLSKPALIHAFDAFESAIRALDVAGEEKAKVSPEMGAVIHTAILDSFTHVETLSPAAGEEWREIASAVVALKWANEKLREQGKRTEYSLGMCRTLAESEQREAAARALLAKMPGAGS